MSLFASGGLYDEDKFQAIIGDLQIVFRSGRQASAEVTAGA
jgi:hypothetical protein